MDLMDAQDKPCLVMLHGWGYDHQCWPEQLIDQLSQMFTLVLLDLPGHGPSPSQYLDIDTWIQEQHQQLPSRYCLLGWSLGGQVAIRWATLVNKDNNSHCGVQQLVLLATNPKFSAGQDWPHAMAQEVLAHFSHSYTDNPANTLRRFASLQAQGCNEAKALVTQMRTLMEVQPNKHYGLALLQQLDERQHLLELAIPCKIELAKDDALVPFNWLEAQGPHANINTSMCDTSYITGGHGYPLQDLGLAHRVIDFLTQNNPPKQQ